jgi:hypothetical protein
LEARDARSVSAKIVPVAGFWQRVHARRGHPHAKARRVDPGKALKEANAAWASVRGHWLHGWDNRQDDRVALERAADELFASGDLPREPDLERLAVAEALLHRRASLVVPIAARYGPATALRVKVESERWFIASGRDKTGWWWMLNVAPPAASRFMDIAWLALRPIACGADEGAYAEMRDAALALRLAEPILARRAAIDFVFPHEPSWAAEDARAIARGAAATKPSQEVAALIGSLADEAAALELIAYLNPVHQLVVATLAYACDVVLALEPDAATRVLAALAGATVGALRAILETDVPTLATAMTSIVSPAMADVLAPYLRHMRFGRHVVAYFEDHAELATRALATSAREKSIAADGARAILEGHARAALADSGSMDDAPALLRDPPWLAREANVVVPLEPLVHAETITWEPGEKERAATMPAVANTSAQVRPVTEAELAEFDALPIAQKYVDVWPRWINKQWLVLDLPDDRRLALWNEKRSLYYRGPDFMLARFDHDALDGLFPRDALALDDDRMFSTCLRVDSPRTALVCARVLARRRPWSKRAKAWLVAHAEAAAIALVPAALGRVNRVRRVAERALRFLAAHAEPTVREVAARYGAAAERAVSDFFFCDPLGRIDVRATPVSWVHVDALPRVRARDGRVLPRLATARIIDVLRSRGVDVPYPGIEVLRDALDPASLSELAWALFHAWARHGRKRVHEWMPRGLAAFHVHDTVAKLAPYVRDWAHSDPRACLTLVDVLAEIGGDDSRVLLDATSNAAASDVLRGALTDALGRANVDAPIDVGLDARGEGLLDLGGRTLRIVLDESFVPHVVLGDRRVAQVPRASKTDDPAKVALATARFNRLRDLSRTIVDTELRKLERAMVESRRFAVHDLEARWARHPLLVHVARRLVWRTHRGDEMETFRVVEDGTYADASDSPIALDPSAPVSVAHPLDMTPELRARWGTLFADYEILQPFEQLGRFVFAGTAAEAVTILKSVAGAIVPARMLLNTLALHRWDKPAGRRVATAYKDLRGKKSARAFLSYAPGIVLSSMRTAPDQKLNAITLPQSPTLDALERNELSDLVRTAIMLRS